MYHRPLFTIILAALLFVAATDLTGINTTDTRMLSQPAISAGQIAFVYAGDLWVAGTDGAAPRRLTSGLGVKSDPYYSPDGSLIAFSAQYDGNTDVFVIPSRGGVPVRLTWHPGEDLARGFTPDGSRVLFASQRSVFTTRYYQLYTVSTGGGFPEKLDIPNAWTASWSPDGTRMAYTPIPPAYQQWKNYRGGRISRIWLYTFGDHSVKVIPQPEGGCNDARPMWDGDKVYFLSDRNGEFNLYAYHTGDGSVVQLTHFDDFPVLDASFTAGTILFEQAGYLHRYEAASGKSSRLQIGIAADLPELRPRYVSGARYVRSAAISPTGARALFGYRGEIVTLPAEKGDPRNITQSPGAHDRYPAWSPDGSRIAFFTDESGEYLLRITSQDGKGESRDYQLPGTGFYAYPHWSPDGTMIAFVDNGRNLFLLNVASGTVRTVDTDAVNYVGAFRDLFGGWSPDSKWIVYTAMQQTFFKVVRLYSVEQNRSFPVTDGLSDASEPIFDPEGRHIYFLASTNAGPVINWFDLSNQDMRMTSSIYLVTLKKELSSPFARESDEEKGDTLTGATASQQDDKGSRKGRQAATQGDTGKKPLTIDTDGLQERILSFPLRPGSYSGLGVTAGGDLLYVAGTEGRMRGGKLYKYSFSEKKESEVMELNSYILSADGKKMLYNAGMSYGITAAGTRPAAGKGTLDLAAVTVRIDPAAEWRQIFDEAWRLNRDYFYDPGMHGADWAAMKKKYEPLLDDLTSRDDLNRLIQWMCSELAVGHHRVGGGERMNVPARVGGGLLGADFEIANNRYRLSKIYGGLNWNPDLRSPLTEPGLNIDEGDYILAIDGHDLTADINIHSLLENSDGKIVELTIGKRPDYNGSRLVRVVPVANENSLRNRDWVEGNLKRVTEATGGRVAYVYVPNTSNAGHEYFKRYFFPQSNRQAIIVDERFNGGGLIADYYIDLLQRPVQSYWNMRYGNDLKMPNASIQGPKVMIIDETAGSGGDMLPWMFRKFGVGTLIGKRTWGGLVGTLGFPELMDGGSVTAPNLAIWTEEGFIVENVGVPPDIEVEQWPAEVISGRDPQLEKAIEVALRELERNPPDEPARPPYPIRVRK